MDVRLREIILIEYFFLDENGEELAIYKKDNDDMKIEVML